eukprot:2583730-Prymnesium_polylepis.1
MAAGRVANSRIEIVSDVEAGAKVGAWGAKQERRPACRCIARRSGPVQLAESDADRLRPHRIQRVHGRLGLLHGAKVALALVHPELRIGGAVLRTFVPPAHARRLQLVYAHLIFTRLSLRSGRGGGPAGGPNGNGDDGGGGAAGSGGGGGAAGSGGGHGGLAGEGETNGDGSSGSGADGGGGRDGGKSGGDEG